MTAAQARRMTESPAPESLLAPLIPGAMCAETFGDHPRMHAAEAAMVAGAVATRRREFGTVRHCARVALAGIGMPPVEILPDRDRVPRWPAGVVGSLTHCHGYRAAAVARSTRVRGIGIDAEPHAPLPGAVPDLVLTPDERARLHLLGNADGDTWWERVAFSAKEAAYKAWFPDNRRSLEFTDLRVTLDPAGSFRVRLPRPSRDLFGRWAVRRGLVLAAVLVPREQRW
jgi:enterobactin synthetase component D / holo-[acyl-carrier protein] synthase